MAVMLKRMEAKVSVEEGIHIQRKQFELFEISLQPAQRRQVSLSSPSMPDTHLPCQMYVASEKLTKHRRHAIIRVRGWRRRRLDDVSLTRVVFVRESRRRGRWCTT